MKFDNKLVLWVFGGFFAFAAVAVAYEEYHPKPLPSHLSFAPTLEIDVFITDTRIDTDQHEVS